MSDPIIFADALGVTALLCIAYSLATASLRYGKPRHHPNSPLVVPTVVPWVGDLIGFLLWRTSLLERYRCGIEFPLLDKGSNYHTRRKYGPIYKFKMAGRYVPVVSTPTTMNNALNVPTKVFAGLEDKSLYFLAGITDRLPDLVDLLYRSTFTDPARRLTGPRMMHCTVPMSKHLFTSLQSLAERNPGETTISLIDYV